MKTSGRSGEGWNLADITNVSVIPYGAASRFATTAAGACIPSW